MEELGDGAALVCEGKDDGLSTSWNFEAGWKHVGEYHFLFFFSEAKITLSIFNGAIWVSGEVVFWAIFVMPIIKEIIMKECGFG